MKIEVVLYKHDCETIMHRFEVDYEKICDIRLIKWQDTWYSDDLEDSIAQIEDDWAFIEVPKKEIMEL